MSSVSGLQGVLEPHGGEGMAVDEVKGWVASEGISWAMLPRAEDARGVLSLRGGGGTVEGWTWVLPPNGARVPH